MTEAERLKRNAYMREWLRKHSVEYNARAVAYRARLSPEEKERQYGLRRKWAESRTPERKEKDTVRIREYMQQKRATPEGAEKLKEALDKYKENNRDAINARNRERRKNPTPAQRKKKNEADRRYRLGWSPERKAEEQNKKREWRRANKDRHTANNQRRDAQKRGNGGSYTATEWQDLKAMFGNSCVCCGRHESKAKLTVDHVIPVTKGGSNNIENLQPLCFSCNSSKQDRTIDYRIAFEEAA